MNTRSHESGSAHILIAALAVVIMGLLGFIFWQNFINKTDDANTQYAGSDTSAQSADVAETATYTLSDAVKDISSVLKAQACDGVNYSDSIVESNFRRVADTDDFQSVGGKSTINTSLTYAYVQYGCGTGGVIGLMKRDGGIWKLVGETARVYPMCSVIEGQGFPRSIVDKCYVNDTDTEPTAI